MTQQQGTKVCTRCGVEKQLNEFNKNNQTKNGLHPWCKSCKAVTGKKRRDGRTEEERIESRRKKRERKKRNSEHYKKYSREWYAKHPEREIERTKKYRPLMNERRKIKRLFNAIGDEPTDWVTE